jgi:flagellar biosynthetic protein FliP
MYQKTKFFSWYKVAFLLALLFAFNCSDVFAASQSFASGVEDLMGNSSITARALQLFVIIAVITVAPSLLIMVTSFVRISIVFAILRSALGLQQSPPNQVLVSLSLFLTFFIMSPTLTESYEKGFKPMLEESMTETESFPLIIDPFKKFMAANTRAKDIDLFTAIAKIEPSETVSDIPLNVIIPAFMISELKRGFEIGFLICLPFLVIDIVVASILMAMGMMMMPPVTVALPFKIIFFVLVDGWYLLSGSLVQSFISS